MYTVFSLLFKTKRNQPYQKVDEGMGARSIPYIYTKLLPGNVAILGGDFCFFVFSYPYFLCYPEEHVSLL